MKCKIPNCEDDARSKGMCVMHYTRHRRHGDYTVDLNPARDTSLDGVLRAYSNIGVSNRLLSTITGLSRYCVAQAVRFK